MPDKGNNHSVSYEYFGDGVYTSTAEGDGIWVLANDHLNPTDRVFLEWGIVRKIADWAVQKKLEQER